MFYLLILAPIVVPLAQRYRSGPALYCLDLFFLSTGLIKAYTRVLLIAFFAGTSFFFPAQNMFPDGYECWEPGHCVFTAYVMQRIEQDRVYREVYREQSHPARSSLADLKTIAVTEKDVAFESSDTPVDATQAPAEVLPA